MTAVLPQNLRLGISLIVFAAFVISVNDIVFKQFADHLSLWQVFAVRGVMTLPILALIGWRHVRQFPEAFAPWPLLRASTFALTLLSFYAALPYLNLATVGAANYTAPLFVAILSAWLLREGLGRWGWLGLGLGFVGILVLLRPGTDAFSPWVLLPLFGAVCYAISHTITRAKCQHLNPLSLSFGQNAMMMVFGFLFGALFLIFSPGGEIAAEYPQIFGSWPTLSSSDWGILLALGLITILASTLIARAYQSAPAPVVATFEYTYLIFAAGWDAVRGDFPAPISLLGIAMIILAGVLVLRKANPSADNRPS